MAKTKKDVKEESKTIYDRAVELGVQNDPYFCSIYHLLEVQLDMLAELEKSFKDSGVLVSKEYVKGRENLYCNPAIDRYTKVSDSATNKIIKLRDVLDKAKEDKLKNEWDEWDLDNVDLSDDFDIDNL